MTFKELIIRAKAGDKSAETSLLLMYQPLLLKASIVNGLLNEDLYQELCIVFLECLRKFKP